VLITRGEEGMTLFTSGGPDGAEVTHIPTVAREVYDVTGAGDTVIATLALALASGASLEEAAVLANHGAGVVVGKVGTASVTRDELLATI
jgi:bifunctional ADP-heptose synthase (sugar kinase/adenylyltransferase)